MHAIVGIIAGLAVALGLGIALFIATDSPKSPESSPGAPDAKDDRAALHDLIRWRLRQYDERDALNPAACAWGRENIDQPVDQRPLFGQRLSLQWQTSADR